MHPSSDEGDASLRAGFGFARACWHDADAPRSKDAASQAALFEAADEVRRRLARDLHDGAQQHLVAALMTLRRARSQARGTRAEALVDAAFEQLEQGLAELRQLARGMHPAVLIEQGLAAALEEVAERGPVPVELTVTGERVPRAVETAIYFFVSEALTNVAKHAHATRATVEVDVDDGMLTAEVRDDGAGGAQLDGGSGLRGLAERLNGLDGSLEIDSPSGRGTWIRARIPLRPHLHAR